MSRTKPTKWKRIPIDVPIKGAEWKGKVPIEIMEAIKALASEEERSFPVTLVRLLRESLITKRRLPSGQQALAVTVAPTTSRQAQAVPPPVPQNALQDLVEDSEGWEGTAPTALGGTKVKM